ncbi:MAG TPA: PQQ-binding-like beta-propeller repeat protein [Pyrinomonadaceae bacterium]|nr:PQQ-binding-like beta-propeller repeat protein [Pyrinomonadaceae bacterium]
MASPAPMFELWKHCPQLACGEPIEPGDATRSCPHCRSGYKVCPTCRATNRLLVEHCRGCGRTLGADAWPTHAGLKAPAQGRASIKTLGQNFSRHLDAQVVCPPLASDRLVFVPQLDGQIAVLQEDDGKQLGSLHAGGRIEATPVLCAGALFVAAGRSLRAFDLYEYLDQPSKEGTRPFWSREAAGDTVIQPLVADERAVYFVSRRGREATLEAANSADGSPAWPEPVSLHTQATHPPVVVNDTLVVVAFDGHVYVVRRETGRLESFSINYRISPQVYPCVSEAGLLLADPDGLVYELVIDHRGAHVNQLFDHGVPLTGIAAGGGLIALAHNSGLTLLTSNGSLRWRFDSFDSFSVPPLVAGRSVFALNDTGDGMLFDELNGNPQAKARMLAGSEIVAPPVMTEKRIVAVSGEGKAAFLDWQ